MGNNNKDVEKPESLYTGDGNVKWCSTVENSMAVAQKIKNNNSTWSSNSTCGFIPKDQKQGHKGIRGHPCSRPHYSQEPKGGSNPSVYPWMNR